MIETSLGPAFDVEDVVATFGADLAAVDACYVHSRAQTPKAATKSAVADHLVSYGDLSKVSGVVACVSAGTRAKTLAAVTAVGRMLRIESDANCAMICGGLVDHTLNEEVELVLWTRYSSANKPAGHRHVERTTTSR